MENRLIWPRKFQRCCNFHSFLNCWYSDSYRCWYLWRDWFWECIWLKVFAWSFAFELWEWSIGTSACLHDFWLQPSRPSYRYSKSYSVSSPWATDSLLLSSLWWDWTKSSCLALLSLLYRTHRTALSSLKSSVLKVSLALLVFFTFYLFST
jgi:hypothetical protein